MDIAFTHIDNVLKYWESHLSLLSVFAGCIDRDPDSIETPLKAALESQDFKRSKKQKIKEIQKLQESQKIQRFQKSEKSKIPKNSKKQNPQTSKT